MNTMPSIREMQGAYLRKDRSYDGIFFLAVKTHGNLLPAFVSGPAAAASECGLFFKCP